MKPQDKNLERLERRVKGILVAYPEVKVWADKGKQSIVVFKWPTIPSHAATLLTESGLGFENNSYSFYVPLLLQETNDDQE